MQPLTPQDNFAYSGDHGDWLVCIGRHRDSCILDNSNFAVVSADLMKRFPDSVVTEGFSNWLVGWNESLLVNPLDRDAVDAAQEWLDKLADYPVANDDHFSTMESEDAWDACTQVAMSSPYRRRFTEHEAESVAEYILDECDDASEAYGDDFWPSQRSVFRGVLHYLRSIKNEED